MFKWLKKISVVVLVIALMSNVVVTGNASVALNNIEANTFISDYENDLMGIANNYANIYPAYSTQIYNLLETYSEDQELQRSYEMSPESAKEIFSRALEINIEISDNNGISPSASTVIGNSLGMLYYCYVDNTIVQDEDNWCGVASALMALTGIETYNRNTLISGYVRPTQSQIAPHVMDDVDNGTAIVGQIASYLNSKLTGNRYTFVKIDGDTTKADIEEYIIHSLSNNRPVILHAKPYSAFSYYSGSGISHTYGHYVVVEDYNSYSDTYTVSDCTYIERYQGRHTGITYDEIYESLYYPSLEITGRYIIYA